MIAPVRRAFVRACTGGVALLASFHAHQAAPTSLYVTVLGTDVPANLTARDFTLVVGGMATDIVRVAPGPQPIAPVVVLDQSDSLHVDAGRIDEAVRQLAGSLTPRDRVQFVTAAASSRTSPWASGTPDEIVRAARSVYQSGGPSPFWDGLDRAVDSARAIADSPRAALLFTDAQGTGNDKGFAEILGRMVDDRVALYVVGLPDRDFPYVEGVRNAELRQVALETGGQFVELPPGSRRAPDYRQVMRLMSQFCDELRHQFRLDFVANVPAGGVHKIGLVINRPGLTVRLRQRVRTVNPNQNLNEPGPLA